MARVSIEVRAAAAAKKLARIMGWSRHEAIGRMYVLWHDSQELEQTECTLGDISTWLDLDADQEGDVPDAMVKSGFLRVIGEDRYEIIGNAKHIEALTQRRDASRDNGKLGGRPKVYENDAKPKDNLADKPRLTQPSNLDEPSRVTQVNPAENLLCSAVLCSAVLCSANKKEECEFFRATPEMKSGDLDRALAQFQKTLDHFKAGRNPLQAEKEELWKMLKSGIAIEELCHALSGMRYETATATYQPSKNISVWKLWDRERRIKMLSLSTQEQQRRESNKPPPRKPAPDSAPPDPTETVRDVGSLFKTAFGGTAK